MELLDFQAFHLVGIKGVAMTALAQCLWDAGKIVTGSDVVEDFVTQPLLDQHQAQIQTSFADPLPLETECVIYTAAHQGQQNLQVQQALQKHLPCFSHAEALGMLFNQKRGIAIAGVGGKSTTSAMIAWILDRLGKNPSFAIGVGKIAGLNKTGQWSAKSDWFVAEADEYAVQPHIPGADQPDWQFIPRFHYLKPQITVCTNLKYDHPDVYPNFQATLNTFRTFFAQMKPGGTLIFNSNNQAQIRSLMPADMTAVLFGEDSAADLRLCDYQSQAGHTISQLEFQGHQYTLELVIPGKYNVMNALAALLAVHQVGVELAEAIPVLAQFHSTMRRFELMGTKNGVTYYDDYAHHPDEVTQVIAALREWYPTQRLIVAFQSHTYSRTKELFANFVTAFSQAQEVVMLDIFPSARESLDPTVTSDQLCAAIEAKYPTITAKNLGTVDKLAEYLRHNLRSGDICITLGAGNIYQVHQLL